MGCVTEQERARRALQLILESATATAGHLYMVDRDNQLAHVMNIGAGEPQDAFESALQSQLDLLLPSNDHQTRTESDIIQSPAASFWVPASDDEQTASYLGLALQKRNSEGRRVVAVAVVLGLTEDPPDIPQRFLDTIAECLVGDALADQAVTSPERLQRR